MEEEHLSAPTLQLLRTRILELAGTLGIMVRITFETNPFIVCSVINTAYSHTSDFAQVLPLRLTFVFLLHVLECSIIWHVASGTLCSTVSLHWPCCHTTSAPMIFLLSES